MKTRVRTYSDSIDAIRNKNWWKIISVLVFIWIFYVISQFIFSNIMLLGALIFWTTFLYFKYFRELFHLTHIDDTLKKLEKDKYMDTQNLIHSNYYIDTKSIQKQVTRNLLWKIRAQRTTLSFILIISYILTLFFSYIFSINFLWVKIPFFVILTTITITHFIFLLKIRSSYVSKKIDLKYNHVALYKNIRNKNKNTDRVLKALPYTLYIYD